jgi:uncharacterized protein (TIGR03083 family)
MAENHRSVIAALAASHTHLEEVVVAVAAVTEPSYCSDWMIAQVLSHLGSGAEIGLLNVNAALAGDPAPARERYLEIWDTWNAKSPADQASDALDADARYISTLQDLDDATLDALRVPMGGRELDAAGFFATRLFEHALHTWDIETMREPLAGILDEATVQLVPRLPDRIGRAAKGAKPSATPARIEVSTVSPDRRFALAIDAEAVAIDDGDAPDGKLAIPGEALLRLVSGRLDDAHTPSGVVAEGNVSLDELRVLFDQG